MPLATFNDANSWLDGTKISFASAVDAEPESQETDRIVRGYLTDLYPDDIHLWVADDPTNPTPELVRAIAALFMAAMRYAKRYSEETNLESAYATRLEAKAMGLIQGLREGVLDLHDVEAVSSLGLDQADFWPNRTTVYEGTDTPLRAFTMEDRW